MTIAAPNDVATPRCLEKLLGDGAALHFCRLP
jgi:hypothetical protein